MGQKWPLVFSCVLWWRDDDGYGDPGHIRTKIPRPQSQKQTHNKKKTTTTTTGLPSPAPRPPLLPTAAATQFSIQFENGWLGAEGERKYTHNAL